MDRTGGGRVEWYDLFASMKCVEKTPLQGSRFFDVSSSLQICIFIFTRTSAAYSAIY